MSEYDIEELENSLELPIGTKFYFRNILFEVVEFEGGAGAAQIVHFPILEEMKTQCVKSCSVLATDMTTINLLTLRKLQKLKEETDEAG